MSSHSSSSRPRRGSGPLGVANPLVRRHRFSERTDCPLDPLPKPISRPQPFGFKVLHQTDDADIDIVAIHDLDGHREDSWSYTDADGMVSRWLSEFLPGSIPMARILTYGYDVATHGRSQLSNQTLFGHGEDLCSKLVLFRRNLLSAVRPLIFVAHGVGGIILKLALVAAFRAHEEHLAHWEDIKFSTYGIIFLGTPHHGFNTQFLESMARSIQSQTGNGTHNLVLKHLHRDSEFLQDLSTGFTAICSFFELAFFHATLETAGQGIEVVTKSSATIPGIVNAQVLGMHRDHENLTRFPSDEDDDYLTLVTTLIEMRRHAMVKVRNRWKTKSVGITAEFGSILGRLEEIVIRLVTHTAETSLWHQETPNDYTSRTEPSSVSSTGNAELGDDILMIQALIDTVSSALRDGAVWLSLAEGAILVNLARLRATLDSGRAFLERAGSDYVNSNTMVCDQIRSELTLCRRCLRQHASRFDRDRESLRYSKIFSVWRVIVKWMWQGDSVVEDVKDTIVRCDARLTQLFLMLALPHSQKSNQTGREVAKSIRNIVNSPHSITRIQLQTLYIRDPTGMDFSVSIHMIRSHQHLRHIILATMQGRCGYGHVVRGAYVLVDNDDNEVEVAPRKLTHGTLLEMAMIERSVVPTTQLLIPTTCPSCKHPNQSSRGRWITCTKCSVRFCNSPNEKEESKPEPSAYNLHFTNTTPSSFDHISDGNGHFKDVQYFKRILWILRRRTLDKIQSWTPDGNMCFRAVSQRISNGKFMCTNCYEQYAREEDCDRHRRTVIW